MIRNHEYITQAVDFATLQMGSKIPTDIDGLFDYGGRAWVIFEMKRCTAKRMPYGQRLALERLVDDLAKARPTIGFVCEYQEKHPNPIDAGGSTVTEYRYKGKWYDMAGIMTLRAAVEGFINKHVQNSV